MAATFKSVTAIVVAIIGIICFFGIVLYTSNIYLSPINISFEEPNMISSTKQA